jgi:hypothetical protein
MEGRRNSAAVGAGSGYGCQTFLPHIRAHGEGGHLVSTASVTGLFAPMPGVAVYNAAKAGIIALSETLAAELAGTSIGVSVVIPAFMQTRAIENADRNAPPVPIYTWTGIYVGVNSGYAFGKQTPGSLFGDSFSAFNYNANGWLGGLTAGAQIQNGHTLLGLEAALIGRTSTARHRVQYRLMALR